MKKNEVKVGQTYRAKITDKVVPVRIDAERPASGGGGWDGTNLHTKRKVHIKSAQKLRGRITVPAKDEPEAATGAPLAPVAKSAAKATNDAKAKTHATGAKDGETKPKRLSLLNAAAQVLAEAKDPMNCQQMVEQVMAQKLWSGNGKTPAATLSSAILRECQSKGDESRFTKVDRGQFELKG